MLYGRVPQEVLSLIASFADRDELKALRLTCHALKDAATRFLFAEIHISLSSHSFDRARNFVSCEYLTKYTRSLVYHLGILDHIYSGFDSFKNEYSTRASAYGSQKEGDITLEVLWAYNCYLEETDGYRTFDLMDEEEELQVLCNALPQLDSLSVRLDEIDYFSPPQDYVSKRTGTAPIYHDYDRHFSRLFRALCERPLRRISTRNMNWDDLADLDEGNPDGVFAYRHCLQHLESLEIGMYITALPDSQNHDDQHTFLAKRRSMEVFDHVLSLSTGLQTLKLDFEELPFESRMEDMLPMSRAIFRHHWPNLRDLKLEVICVRRTELVAFLEAHRSTLRRLQIGDVELAPERKGYSSILHLFWDIREVLELDQCHLTGNFTNRFNEAWYVDTEHRSDSCLRDHLENYMCRGILSSHPDFEYCRGFIEDCVACGPFASTLEFPDEPLTSDIFCDQSWQSCPELIQDVSAGITSFAEDVAQWENDLD